MEAFVREKVDFSVNAFAEASISQDELIAYGSVISMAVFPIIVGSYRSLSTMMDKKGQRKKDNGGMETMSSQDAYMFPFIGSAVLFGLYLVFKFFSKEYVNMLLGAYFLFLGVAACTTTLAPVMTSFLPKSSQQKNYSIQFTIPVWKRECDWQFTQVDLVSFLVSLVLGCWYITTKHWIANNFLGLAFSVQGITLLSLGSVQVGCILLWGLFVYDIFWVFGTDVMVTVATSFEAPIKLKVPKNILESFFEGNPLQFSMLGLGDIVIPGIFVALLLRYDFWKQQGKTGWQARYFNVCATAYTLGLLTTITVMHVFKAAQPALLYLVPFCTGSALLLAAVRGEFRDLLSYSEADESAEDEDAPPEKALEEGEEAPEQKANTSETKSKKKTSTTATSSVTTRRRSAR
eukprot:CAMPEP_0174241392 /NCGR_PEP_ID=MMETSP0417-20130205/23212_1 /TAXON_ID=242541 /ORGANISM="Mayorella sp, Strain BSH-02190019" /LENGTH=403 /DNA_ID=CAMNT_0015320625 /DNA_START=1 /DNA_END=1209 /DNA_ORIENTATION=+